MGPVEKNQPETDSKRRKEKGIKKEVHQPKPAQQRSLDYYIYEEQEEDEEPVGGQRPSSRCGYLPFLFKCDVSRGRGGGIPMRSHHRTSEVQAPHLTADSSIFSQG